MPCVAEFEIIDNFDKNKDYSDYEPEKYHCIVIVDDILDDWWKQLVPGKRGEEAMGDRTTHLLE